MSWEGLSSDVWSNDGKVIVKEESPKPIHVSRPLEVKNVQVRTEVVSRSSSDDDDDTDGWHIVGQKKGKSKPPKPMEPQAEKGETIITTEEVKPTKESKEKKMSKNEKAMQKLERQQHEIAASYEKKKKKKTVTDSVEKEAPKSMEKNQQTSNNLSTTSTIQGPVPGNNAKTKGTQKTKRKTSVTFVEQGASKKQMKKQDYTLFWLTISIVVVIALAVGAMQIKALLDLGSQ